QPPQPSLQRSKRLIEPIRSVHHVATERDHVHLLHDRMLDDGLPRTRAGDRALVSVRRQPRGAAAHVEVSGAEYAHGTSVGGGRGVSHSTTGVRRTKDRTRRWALVVGLSGWWRWSLGCTSCCHPARAKRGSGSTFNCS